MSSRPLIGWLGGALLAICAIPEAIRTIELGRCDIGWGMLSTWYIGEILLFIYVLPTRDKPLLLNYFVNIVAISVMIGYKI
jgi:hypothetical protein